MMFFVVEDEELEPSSSVEDMSAKSAETIILVFFETVSIHFLMVKKHFLPLGKALNVKCRSLGKYQLLLPLAKALVKAGHVKIEVEDGSEVNYRDVSRKQVKKCADIESLSKTSVGICKIPTLVTLCPVLECRKIQCWTLSYQCWKVWCSNVGNRSSNVGNIGTLLDTIIIIFQHWKI